MNHAREGVEHLMSGIRGKVWQSRCVGYVVRWQIEDWVRDPVAELVSRQVRNPIRMETIGGRDGT